jgi:predicted DNA-binding transcriptional regulator YafY
MADTPFMLQIKVGSLVQFDYTNHRNEQSHRYVLVMGFDYGMNEYYATPQFLMRAFEVERQVIRSFAINKITNLELLHRS